MKIIFFGTPPFAAHVLEYLLKNGVDVVAVVSKPDRAKGRSATPVPTSVKVAAQTFNPALPVYQPEVVSDLAFAPTLQQYQADLFVVVAYGELIKQHLLDMPRLGCINLHASLLPKYRGAAPIQHCIIEGEPESGVTIMHMVRKMDAGDIIEMAKVPIGPEMTYGELEEALCQCGKVALLKVMHDIEKGSATRIPQDHAKATLAPKIELENCEIKWDQPANRIHDLVRGVNPHPGAWCWLKVRGEQKRFKLLKTRVGELLPDGASSGQIIVYGKQGLAVAAQDHALELLEVQLEGKKPMSGAEFVRGFAQADLSFL